MVSNFFYSRKNFYCNNCSALLENVVFPNEDKRFLLFLKRKKSKYCIIKKYNFFFFLVFVLVLYLKNEYRCYSFLRVQILFVILRHSQIWYVQYYRDFCISIFCSRRFIFYLQLTFCLFPSRYYLSKCFLMASGGKCELTEIFCTLTF